MPEPDVPNSSPDSRESKGSLNLSHYLALELFSPSPVTGVRPLKHNRLREPFAQCT